MTCQLSAQTRNHADPLLTVIQSINTTPERELVRSNDASIDRKQAACNPPADRVTQKVDLLTGLILGPETNTPEQEWPLVGLRGVRVAAGQLVVVPEHGPLKLKPLPQERQGLHLALRLLPPLVICRQGWDVLDQPDIRTWCDLLVAVDLLLLVAPLRERCRVSPHGDFAGVMDELEVA